MLPIVYDADPKRTLLAASKSAKRLVENPLRLCDARAVALLQSAGGRIVT
jgi:hypothetical protein